MRRHWTPGGGIRLRWALKRLTNRLGCWRFGHGPHLCTGYWDEKAAMQAARHAVVYGGAFYRPMTYVWTCAHCGAITSRSRT